MTHHTTMMEEIETEDKQKEKMDDEIRKLWRAIFNSNPNQIRTKISEVSFQRLSRDLEVALNGCNFTLDVYKLALKKLGYEAPKGADKAEIIEYYLTVYQEEFWRRTSDKFQGQETCPSGRQIPAGN